MEQRRSKTAKNFINSRLPLWIAYGLLLSLSAVIIFEYFGITNIVQIGYPLSSGDFAQIASAIGTILLTFGLLLLYDKQAEIQSNQEELMEQQYTPYLTGEVDYLNITSVQFLIRNSGNGPAFDVEATWEVAGESREWAVPSISPDEEQGFPVIVDGEDWLLTTDSIQEYLDEKDASTEIIYTLSCKDRFGNEFEYNGSVDFSVLMERSDSNEIWENDPLEEMSNELSKIQRDIRKISSVEKSRDKATNWQHRIEQNSVIIDIVNQYGPISKNDLHRITNISERNLEYRLQSLDDIGSINYHENTNTIKSPREKQDVKLSDF